MKDVHGVSSGIHIKTEPDDNKGNRKGRWEWSATVRIGQTHNEFDVCKMNIILTFL